MLTKIESAKRIAAGFIGLLLGERAKVSWNNRASYSTSGVIHLPTPKTGDESELSLLNRLAMHETGHAKFSNMYVLQDVDALSMNFFNPLEDARIESMQMRELPGAALILNQGLESTLRKLMDHQDLTDLAQAAKAIGISCMFRANEALGRFASLKADHPIRELIREYLNKSNALLRPDQVQSLDVLCGKIIDCESSRDVLRLTALIIQALKEQPPPPQNQSDPETGQDSQPHDDQSQEQQQFASDIANNQGVEDQSQSTQGNAESADSEPSEPEADDSQPNEAGMSNEQTEQSGQSTANTSGQQNEASQEDVPAQTGSAADQAAGQGEATASAGQQAQDQAGQPAPLDFNNLEEFEAEDLGHTLRKMLGQDSTQEDAKASGSDQTTEEQGLSPEQVGQLLEQAQDEGMDFQELMTLMEQVLEDDIEQAVEATDQAEPSDESTAQPLSAGGAAAPIIGSTVPDVRLSGYAGHVARVFTKALQDKRHRNLMPAKRGLRIIAKRVWRAEALGDMRIYRGKSQVSGIETSMMLLLDRSYSMKEGMQMALDATMCCAQGLERLHTCKTAISLFPGEDYRSSSYQPLMRFGESARRVFKKIEGLKADGGTPLAQAVIQAVADLKARKTHKHVLGIITDGIPDDTFAAIAALKYAQEQGVEVFGIGIGRDARLIQGLIPRANMINDVQELAPALEAIFAGDIEALAA